jgi:transposase
MQSHEVLREVLKNTSAKQISADLNLSLSLIYKWAEAPDPEALTQSHNPLDRLDQLFQSTHDLRLIHWLCERAGGFFIHNPKRMPDNPDRLMPATNEIVQEFADLLAVVAGAASDHSVNAAEAKKIRARWEELKTVTETFVRCCEEGNFATAKAAIPDAKP